MCNTLHTYLVSYEADATKRTCSEGYAHIEVGQPERSRQGSYFFLSHHYLFLAWPVPVNTYTINNQRKLLALTLDKVLHKRPIETWGFIGRKIRFSTPISGGYFASPELPHVTY